MFGLFVLATMNVAESPKMEILFPRKNQLVLLYEGKTVLIGETHSDPKPGLEKIVHLTYEDQPVEPMFLGYPHGPKTADWTPKGAMRRTWKLIVSDPNVKITTEVPKIGDRRPVTTSLSAPLISTFGDATPTFTNAIYDRDADLLIEGEQIKASPTGFQFVHTAETLAEPLILKTDYFKNHLGYFLWDKKRPLWSKPVAGWCSWAAYGQDVTEKNVADAAKFFSQNLKAYGYSVIQIDDGYQRVLQITDNHQPITEPFANYWTKANEKFPSGMAAMASTISKLGLIPGIWVGLYLPIGLNHASSYVTDPNGKPHQGPWVGYAMNSADQGAVAEAYTDTLKTFREEGWKYFKIDTLRHVLYDSYRKVPEYWAARQTESSYAYRNLFADVREAVGKDNYLLACWGALPELAGLPDGCRIGEDVGPTFNSMRRSAKYIAQFHYANDVIWRNDPDYMCFRVPVEQCQTWATLTSLTGEHVMVSDPIETYDPARVDVLRRVGPPVISKPAVAAPRPPDALQPGSLRQEPEWTVLAASKAGQSWTVVARTAWEPLRAEEARLTNLGLQSATPYLAFDFWNSKFLGVVTDNSTFDALEPGHCQVVAFRPATNHPQVLGDDRHISQGAYELENVKWDRKTLSGRFKIAPGREWSLYLYAPQSYKPTPQPGLIEVQPNVWKLTLPEGDGWKNWKVKFASHPS